jgi:hypothetical protein
MKVPKDKEEKKPKPPPKTSWVAFASDGAVQIREWEDEKGKRDR